LLGHEIDPKNDRIVLSSNISSRFQHLAMPVRLACMKLL